MMLKNKKIKIKKQLLFQINVLFKRILIENIGSLNPQKSYQQKRIKHCE